MQRARKMPFGYSNSKIMSNNQDSETQSGLSGEVMNLPSSQRNLSSIWVAGFGDSREELPTRRKCSLARMLWYNEH